MSYQELRDPQYHFKHPHHVRPLLPHHIPQQVPPIGEGWEAELAMAVGMYCGEGSDEGRGKGEARAE